MLDDVAEGLLVGPLACDTTPPWSPGRLPSRPPLQRKIRDFKPRVSPAYPALEMSVIERIVRELNGRSVLLM